MDLLLQMGYGMKKHCIDLVSSWGGGTVILSPKDMTIEQMQNMSDQLQRKNGTILIDPQFYYPHSLKPNLQTHPFWPKTYDTSSFFSGRGIEHLINVLITSYIEPMNASAIILPMLKLDDMDENWDKIADLIINESLKKKLSIPTYCTLCLSDTILKDENKVHELLEHIENYPVDGFYIIPIHPQNNYLVDDMSWLINLIDLCAGLKICKKNIIVGYSGHQFLFLALAKIDAIGAGTWLKTRRFLIGDFDNSEPQEQGRRSTWYYCPQALSEYQIGFLDIAYRLKHLDILKTPNDFGSHYADILFGGAQPTTVSFSEPQAFRHYLHCLRFQCKEVSKTTYDETLNYLKLIFETALELTVLNRSKGIRGNYRDFSEVVESNLAILDAFSTLRGLIYRHKWKDL
jgi:hypothetical protein